MNPVAAVERRAAAVSRHVADLNGKRVCLFRNSKRPAGPMLEAIKSSLSERFSGLSFHPFLQEGHADLSEQEMSGIAANADLVIAAVGD